MSDFDLVVVGTGSSGNAVALHCARAGRRVAIVDKVPYGGTCALRGCDPKKVLVGAAEVIDWVQRMQGSGIAGDSRIDWPELMRFKRTFTQPVPQEREAKFRELGIATYHGTARFTASSALDISGEAVAARHVVLAAGSRPATLHLQGEEHLITSTGFLDLERLPARVAFVGGGYIAFEFAHVAARAGAAVTILQRGPRALTGFDPDLVDRVVEVSREVGIDVRVDAKVGAVEKKGDVFTIAVTQGGREFTIECDLVVHAAGRVPDLDDLALEAGGVERTVKGVAVNEFLQSRSNPAVYAVGDCADGGGLPLTPTAAVEGETAARNLLQGNRYTMDFSGLASIVYTIPSLGTAGLTADQATARGLRFSVHQGDSTKWYSSRRTQTRASAYKVLVEEGSGKILGASVLGQHTEELINIFSLAIRTGLPALSLIDTLFGYPTASSDMEFLVG
jgi:glutathione reductase (NADPH)